MKVLICRPDADAKILANILSDKGVDVVSMPTIEIEYLSFEFATDNFTDIIFTSKHAVNSFLSKNISLEHIKVWAIGESTANELYKKIGVDSIYPQKSNSYELLELIKYDDIASKSISIISGADGNGILEKELEQSTKVTKTNVYVRNAVDTRLLRKQYSTLFNESNVPGIIVITSLDILKSFNQIFIDSYVYKPTKSIITITSSKMLEYSNKFGFNNTLILDKFDNKYISEKICKILGK